MNSSGAVFTRQNPFPPDPPLGKTHYSPSRIRKLPKQQRKTTLSPVRLAQLPGPPSPPPQIRSLSPEDRRFLREASHLVLCPPPASEAQPSFSESWPSTDPGTSPANTTASPDTPALTWAAAAGKSLVSAGGEGQDDSVLARYIERFRHGRPQSREERQEMAAVATEGQGPFWWLSPSPLPSSSTPTPTTDTGLRIDPTASILSPVGPPGHDSTLSPCRVLLDLSAMGLSDSSQCDPGEPEVLQLQQRALSLLQRSEHSLGSGSIPISSEGLGCSDFSSPVSVDEPVRRPMIPSLMDSTTALNLNPAALDAGRVPKPSGAGPSAPRPGVLSSVPRTRPEEDILFQWRLRRKMEEARHRPPSHTHTHTQQARQWPPTHTQQARQWPPTHTYDPSLHQTPTTPVSWQTQVQESLHPADPSHRVTPSFTPAPRTIPAPLGLSTPAAAPSPSLPISSPTVSKLQSDATDPSHITLLRDVPSCPTQPAPTNSQTSPPPTARQRSPQRGEKVPRQPPAPTSSTQPQAQHRSRQPVTQARHPPAQPSLTQPPSQPSSRHPTVQASLTDTSTEEPSSNHGSSPPPPAASSDTTEEDWRGHQRREERKNRGMTQRREEEEEEEKKKKEKRTGPSSRKKKAPRHHGGAGDHGDRGLTRHSRGQHRVTTPWREERGQVSAREAHPHPRPRPGDCPPPPSPIHSAMGQVVSEVLFPAPDSPPPAPRTPASVSSDSDSPRYVPPAPPQSPVPATSPVPQPRVRQPREVISQLLLEAEDSDETEFEDDSLLQVLRQQRRWVKEQIREVDAMLEEQGRGKETHT